MKTQNTLEIFRARNTRTAESASLMAGLRDLRRIDRARSKPAPYAWLPSQAI